MYGSEEETRALEGIKRKLGRIKRDGYWIAGKRKVFSEKEILFSISQDCKWPANFQVFFQVFIEQGSKCNFGLIQACYLAVDLLLLTKNEHWFVASRQMNEYKDLVLQVLNESLTDRSLDLSELMNLQRSLFMGNSLNYNKDLVDSLVVEAFVKSLGHFSISSIQDILFFVWEKNLPIGNELNLISGFAFKSLESLAVNSYKVIHFTNSKNKIGIPNSLDSISYNNESINLNEDSIESICLQIKKLGAELVICQKLISDQMKTELKKSKIAYIERLGTENSNKLSKASKKIPVNSVFLIKPQDVFEIAVKELQVSIQKKIKYIESDQQTVLVQSIIQEDFEYIQEVFKTSFQVLLHFVENRKTFTPVFQFPLNSVYSKFLQFFESIPSISHFLSHFSLSIEALTLFLHCSPLDLAQLDT